MCSWGYSCKWIVQDYFLLNPYDPLVGREASFTNSSTTRTLTTLLSWYLFQELEGASNNWDLRKGRLYHLLLAIIVPTERKVRIIIRSLSLGVLWYEDWTLFEEVPTIVVAKRTSASSIVADRTCNSQRNHFPQYRR